MERQRMHNFKSINEIFCQDDSLRNLRKFIKQADVISLFNEIFPDLKKIAKAVKIEKSVLYLRVENSVWRSELKFKQKIIIDRINCKIGEDILKSVKFLA